MTNEDLRRPALALEFAMTPDARALTIAFLKSTEFPLPVNDELIEGVFESAIQMLQEASDGADIGEDTPPSDLGLIGAVWRSVALYADAPESNSQAQQLRQWLRRTRMTHQCCFESDQQ